MNSFFIKFKYTSYNILGGVNITIKECPLDERPRELLKQNGKEYISNSDLLSIILKTGTKNRSVKEISLELLNKYKIDYLKEISLEELKKIDGIGEVKAIEILASIELGKRIFLKTNKELKKLKSPKDIYEDSKYLFNNKKQEYFYCYYFNNKQELIGRKLLFIGTINQSITHPREIFKEAYKLSASSIICVHNHPSNDLNPSKADINFTNNIIIAGKYQGIPVLDHIIICNNAYYSFLENNLMSQ